MLTPYEALNEFADNEVAQFSRPGGQVAHKDIMSLLPPFEHAIVYVNKCKVLGARLSLIAGNIPMVRVSLSCKSPPKQRFQQRITVNASSWLPDVLEVYHLDGNHFNLLGKFSNRLAVATRKAISPERLAFLEADIKNAGAKALVDEHQVQHILARVDKKKELHRQRLIREVSQVFRDVRGVLTEEEIILLYRENTVRDILES